MLMKSYQYEQVEKEKDLHFQAFLNFSVQSTKGSGKHIRPMYPDFKSFFNYDERIRYLEGNKAKPKLDNRLKKALELQRIANNKRKEE